MNTTITAPQSCPDCGSEITEYREPTSGILTHWCNNLECVGRIADMLTFVADRSVLEIDGLGLELASLLARERYVIVLSDLFEFGNIISQKLATRDTDTVIQSLASKGLPGAAVVKMANSLQRAKTLPWDKWLTALSIPMIGISLARELAKALDLQSEYMGILPSKLARVKDMNIPGIGPAKRAEIDNFAGMLRTENICTSLYKHGVRPTPLTTVTSSENQPLANMVFCITGEFWSLGSREFITEQLTKLGATAKTGVSKKVNHLLVGSDAGKTKLTKAKELGIPCYNEEWLKDLCTKHGIKTSDANLDWA